MPIELIQKAIQYAKEERLRLLSLNMGIYDPLTPRAVHSHTYLLVREYINIGCREAVKLLLNPYHRSIAYSILVSALEDLFHLGYHPEIIAYHNELLDEMIGTH